MGKISLAQRKRISDAVLLARYAEVGFIKLALTGLVHEADAFDCANHTEVIEVAGRARQAGDKITRDLGEETAVDRLLAAVLTSVPDLLHPAANEVTLDGRAVSRLMTMVDYVGEVLAERMGEDGRRATKARDGGRREA